MKRTEFSDLCLAVVNGDTTRMVQNQHLLYTGQVTTCRNDQLIVDAFGHSYAWGYGECREVDGRGDPLGPPTNQ